MSKLLNSLLILNQGSGEEPNMPDLGDGMLVAPEKLDLKQPSLFQVLMLNDDFTPMHFVVEVLVRFFRMNEEQATQTMLAVHTQGQAVCGIFTKDIAETKVAQVNQYAEECDHPLLCEMQEVD